MITGPVTLGLVVDAFDHEVVIGGTLAADRGTCTVAGSTAGRHSGAQQTQVEYTEGADTGAGEAFRRACIERTLDVGCRGIDDGRGLNDGHRTGYCADFESCVDRGGAVQLDHDVGDGTVTEPGGGNAELIRADWHVVETVLPRPVRLRRVANTRGDIFQIHGSAVDGAAGRIRYGTEQVSITDLSELAIPRRTPIRLEWPCGTNVTCSFPPDARMSADSQHAADPHVMLMRNYGNSCRDVVNCAESVVERILAAMDARGYFGTPEQNGDAGQNTIDRERRKATAADPIHEPDYNTPRLRRTRQQKPIGEHDHAVGIEVERSQPFGLGVSNGLQKVIASGGCHGGNREQE